MSRFAEVQARSLHGHAASPENVAVVRAKHGWVYWLEVSFLFVIAAGCTWAGVMLALYPSDPGMSGYRIVLLLAVPFALLHLGLVLVLRPDRVIEASEEGVRLFRGTKLRESFGWSDVSELKLGYLPRGSVYHGIVQQGYRIRVVRKKGGRSVSLDSVRYDLPTQQLIDFAGRVSILARSHGVSVIENPSTGGL